MRAPKLLTRDNQPIPDNATITLSAAALRGYLQAYGGEIAQGIVSRIELAAREVEAGMRTRPAGSQRGLPELVAALETVATAIGATRVSVREVERDPKGMITRVRETVASE